MPRLTLDKLRSSLRKGQFAAAYYVHGTEGILKDEVLGLILDGVLDPATRDFNLDILSAQQVDPAELAAACSTLPMMAARRVVVMRDVESWKRKSKAKLPAVAYLERPMPETVLVLVQGNDDDPDDELASRCESIDCAALAGDRLDAWLDERLERHGVVLAPDGREHLVRATAGDLGMLAAEVEKLSGLEVAGPIGAETVSALVGVRLGETPEDWRDAVLRDDVPRALALVPKLLEVSGVTGVSLVGLLATSLLAVRWARDVVRRDRQLRGSALTERIKRDFLFKNRPRLGNYDGFARLVAEVVGQWPHTRVIEATAALLQADVALKGNTISDPGAIVTDLALALAMSRVRKAA